MGVIVHVFSKCLNTTYKVRVFQNACHMPLDSLHNAVIAFFKMYQNIQNSYLKTDRKHPPMS